MLMIQAEVLIHLSSLILSKNAINLAGKDKEKGTRNSNQERGKRKKEWKKVISPSVYGEIWPQKE